MNTRLYTVVEYLLTIIKKYNELLQNNIQKDFFRIVDTKCSKYEGNIIKVQIIGKSNILEFPASEIVANDKLLEGFSKKDIRTITYLASQDIKRPKYKIFAQEFRDNFKKIIFMLNKKDSKELILKSAQEISLDKDILKNLDALDAHLVGYITGTENAQNEKKQLATMTDDENISR